MEDALVETIFILVVIVVYFIPTIVAYFKNHINTLAIFILNLFFGCTLIGWVAALIWAVYNKDVVKVKKVK